MPELPGGTLTMLHTDVEESTLLTVHLGDRYPEVLASHRTVVRAAFALLEGHEVDTQGDSFFVVFARATRQLPQPWRFSAPSQPKRGPRAGPCGCESAFTRENRSGRRKDTRGWMSSAARASRRPGMVARSSCPNRPPR